MHTLNFIINHCDDIKIRILCTADLRGFAEDTVGLDYTSGSVTDIITGDSLSSVDCLGANLAQNQAFERSLKNGCLNDVPIKVVYKIVNVNDGTIRVRNKTKFAFSGQSIFLKDNEVPADIAYDEEELFGKDIKKNEARIVRFETTVDFCEDSKPLSLYADLKIKQVIGENKDKKWYRGCEFFFTERCYGLRSQIYSF